MGCEDRAPCAIRFEALAVKRVVSGTRPAVSGTRPEAMAVKPAALGAKTVGLRGQGDGVLGAGSAPSAQPPTNEADLAYRCATRRTGRAIAHRHAACPVGRAVAPSSRPHHLARWCWIAPASLRAEATQPSCPTQRHKRIKKVTTSRADCQALPHESGWPIALAPQPSTPSSGRGAPL